MESLKSKKLLILGGSAYMTDVINKAKELGIYTIVTDWHNPDRSPAKKIADEYWMVSLSEIDELAKLVKEHNIDGIFTNYTDLFLPYYVALCEKTGLPCLANMDQISAITYKDLSKQMCIDHGISVSKRYPVAKPDELDNLKDIQFPVLTKPVDNSGQNGIYVCTNWDDLKTRFEESFNYSVSKKVMVEEYVQGDYAVMFYTVQNGHVTLASMADKPVYGNFENNLPKLPMGYFMPSQYVDLCEKIMLPKVQSFVTDLGLKNGVIGIEGVVKDNDIFVFEMQFRLGGMHHHDFVRKENGMDIMAMLLRFAITGKFEGWDASVCDNAHFKNHYCSLNIFIEPFKKIAKIENIEKIKEMSPVYGFKQMLYEGDIVQNPGTTSQIFCKVSLEDTDYDALIRDLQYIQEMLGVYDEEGNNLILKLW